MTTNDFLRATYKVNEEIRKIQLETNTFRDGDCPIFVRPRAICADGYSVSIQANYRCFCTPRITMKAPYSTVELGYPSAHDAMLDEYADYDYDYDVFVNALCSNNYIPAIYAYVPVEVVDQLLEKHGGIVSYEGMKRSDDIDGSSENAVNAE